VDVNPVARLGGPITIVVAAATVGTIASAAAASTDTQAATRR
jgi:hypothetical protein